MHPRNYRLVIEFLADLEQYAGALTEEKFAAAAKMSELDLFARASAMYGEGFGVFFANALKQNGCNSPVVEQCPLVISAYFKALAAFAAVGRDQED